jgi:hypothetical protein
MKIVHWYTFGMVQWISWKIKGPWYLPSGPFKWRGDNRHNSMCLLNGTTGFYPYLTNRLWGARSNGEVIFHPQPLRGMPCQIIRFHSICPPTFPGRGEKAWSTNIWRNCARVNLLINYEQVTCQRCLPQYPIQLKYYNQTPFITHTPHFTDSKHIVIESPMTMVDTFYPWAHCKTVSTWIQCNHMTIGHEISIWYD